VLEISLSELLWTGCHSTMRVDKQFTEG